MTTPAQRHLGQSQLDLARRFGVGGSRWTVERRSGDGITTAATAASVGTVTAYVRKLAPHRLEAVLAGGQVGAARWQVYADAAQDIRINDLLRSEADAALAFTVTELSAERGILVGLVEQHP